MRSTYALATSARGSSLAAKLWRVSLVRGLIALGVGAGLLLWPSDSPAALVHAVSAYWIFDGVVALWASVWAVIRTANRVVLAIRGVVGIGAAVVLFLLPLDQVFGPWRPGQLMLLILTMGPAFLAIGWQIVTTASVDLLIGLQVRQQVPGEWSVALGAVVSIVLGGLVVAGLCGPLPVVGRVVGVVGAAGGLALIAGALRLRAAG